MIVLALDSSAATLSVALLRGADPLAERGWRARRPHGEALIPAIEATLRDAQFTLDEIEMIAVATGPGSFNGIRGGIAVATGLALARSLPAVGVPTLDALAYAQAGRAEVVCALLPAGRGEFYGASFGGTWQNWRRRGDYTVAPLDEQLRNLPAGTLLCGDLPQDIRERVAARGLTSAPAVASFARAAFVGALAAARAAEAGFDAAASLRALYLRRPGITQSARVTGLAGGAP